MGRTSGRWHGWKRILHGLGLFWRNSCRPFANRRNIPYLVLLALVAFLFSSKLSGRRPPANPVPADLAVSASPAESAIHLGQSPAEVYSAWEAIAGREQNMPESTAVDPAAFALPCKGLVLEGRGWRRDAQSGIWVYHRGVDLRVNGGEPVTAIASGKIVRVAPGEEEGGMLVEIDHGNGWRSICDRLGRVCVETGAAVVGKAPIGWPLADVIHLEIRHGETILDPLSVLPGLG